VALQPGSNVVEVKATRNGQTLTDRVTWTYTPQPSSRPAPMLVHASEKPFVFFARSLAREVELA
jgi:hypothetical protein